MSNKTVALTSVLSIALLTACTPARKEAARFDFSAIQCAKSIDNLRLNNIPRVSEKNPKAALKLNFQSAAGCISTQDGTPLPIVLLGLDGKVPSQLDFLIQIKNEVAFAAAIDLIDPDGRLVRTIPFADFSKRGGSYTYTLFLNASDAKVRQLALRPDSNIVGQTDKSITGKRIENPFLLVAGSVAFYGTFTTGSEVVARAWLSEVGNIHVRLSDYAPREINPVKK